MKFIIAMLSSAGVQLARMTYEALALSYQLDAEIEAMLIKTTISDGVVCAAKKCHQLRMFMAPSTFHLLLL